MVTEIVCPGTLLLGEVVMAPDKVAPYFGSMESPECHLLYNVTTMATLWHTAATGDVRLLRFTVYPGDASDVPETTFTTDRPDLLEILPDDPSLAERRKELIHQKHIAEEALSRWLHETAVETQ